MTLKLPPEILVVIFTHLGRNSKDLAHVTAVCSRWRTIAIQTPYIWTEISVTITDISDMRNQQSLTRLDTFLSRTGDLPLDVELRISGKGNNTRPLCDILRKKGPICRWRNVTLDLSPKAIQQLKPLYESDRFSNLSYLHLISNPSSGLIDVLNAVATTNQIVLELGAKFHCPSTFYEDYKGILSRTKNLSIWSQIVLPPTSPPPNVMTLQVHTMPNIPIPHIRHLFVIRIHLERFSCENLDNLTTLLIHSGVDGAPEDFTVILPNLLWLGFYGNTHTAARAFKVPSLHTLTIKNADYPAQSADGPLVTALRRGFEAPKLLILFLEIGLEAQATLEILRLFPDLSRVDIYCRGGLDGTAILTHVFPRQREATLCPTLDVIRLVLASPPENLAKWKELVRRTTRQIKEPFWLLETIWPDGRFAACLRVEKTQKVPCIQPWIQPR